MSGRLKTVLVVLMLALVPLRALATVTVGFCAMHHHGSASADVGHGHEHDGTPSGESNRDPCNSCVEHCASASVIAVNDPPSPPAAGSQRISASERFAAGFVADQLDPPPLAL